MKLKKRLGEPLLGLFRFCLYFIKVSVPDGVHKPLKVLNQKVQIYVLVLSFDLNYNYEVYFHWASYLFYLALVNDINPLMPVPPVTAHDEPWPFFHF